MLSKNNKRLQAEKMEPKHQRFAIKKFTVGVASVLIGTTFAINMGTKVVSADETTAQTTEVVGDSLAETSSEKNEATSEETSVATTSENEVVAPEVTAQETQAKKEETSDAKQTQSPEETNSNESATETKISDQDQNKTETSTAPQATETASAFRSASETTVAPTTAETTAPEETATSETKNPQWPAAADAAVTNDNGIYTPQISYNRKFWTFQANPGMITDEVTLKEGAIAKTDLKYYTGVTVGDDAKNAIENTANFPKNATYAWVTKPNTTQAQTTSGQVKVTFPDELDPTYTHELLVTVPATVTDIDLTKSTIEVNKPTLHVNQDIDTVNDMLTRDYVENELIKKLTLANGTVFEGQELKDVLNAFVAEYSWADDPDTTTAGENIDVRLRAKLNNKRTTSWPMKIDVVGAQAKPDLQTPWGTELEAYKVIANTDELERFDTADKKVSYAWKEKPNFKPGVSADHHVPGVVVVTYPDGTTQDVPVTIKVGDSQADAFAAKDKTATTQKITVHYGQTVNPNAGLVDPTGNNVKSSAFVTPVNTTTASNSEHPATVTFTDGSTAPVDILVEVIVATPKSDATTPWGKVPEAKSLIANTEALAQFDQSAKPVSYAWKQEPNVKPEVGATDRKATGIVTVTYPDGTTQDVEVNVLVDKSDADTYTPNGQEVKTPVGGTPKATTGIANLDELPKGTTATWKEPVDTTTPGHKKGTVVVTYPDGTTEEVTVPVKVGTDAQINEPTAQEVKTPVGGTPEATTGIKNLDELPVGTTVAWKEPIDTTTPGHKEGTVVVTYPDGTTEEVTVPVKVGTDAQINEPTAQEVKTPVGGTPDATTGIKNLDELPVGTTVAWKEPIDTTTPGHKEGTVVVTYPDGTTEEVTVPVKVGTDAQINEPTAQEVKTPVGGTPEATTGIANLDELPAGTKAAWKEPVDTTTPGHKEGTVVVTYPDGTTEEVTVPVKVGTDAQINEPTAQEVKTPVGGTPDATTGIKNLDELPVGTTVTWKEPVDTTTPGHKEGTVVVTYPDGTTEEVTVPVKVGTDAQINEPTAQEVKTPVGGTPKATTGIANLDELPAGTTVTWKEPVDTTTPGHKEGTVVVTYPDGTTEEVTVPVKVGTDAQINEPTAQEVKTPVGGTPKATTGIANLDELPAGTKATWKEPVDTKTPGHKEGTVVVTYPDGTTEEVTVPVKVGTDADIYTPNGQEVKTPVGGTPEATTGITNLDELPAGTKATWKEPVDTKTPGHKEGTVVVTYPDGTTEEVTVPVKVGTDAQINEPTAQEVKTPVGGTPEATTGIKNLDELPVGTTVAWKEPVDTKTPGHKEGTVVVTYPDGTTEEVTVPVKVGTDAQINEPTGQEVKTPVGGTPDATTGIANLDELPKGTTVTWKEPVDTKTPGHKEGTVVVTYPDGTTEEVTVPVKVGTDADIYTPNGQEVKTPVGGTPEATTGITNLDELPAGTKATWKEPVDTKTPGHKEGTVVVTYPDGTTEEVTVPVKVGTDAQINEPTTQEVKTPVGGTPDATTGIKNLDELPAGTTVTWKEPVDTTTPGHKEGTVVVTYPDGTTEEVTVPVKVGTDAQINEPTGQEVKTPVGGTPDATTGIANLDELPAGTTVTWKEPVDTKTPGHKEGTVVVTYPDGTTEEVTVPVKVGTDADIYTPSGQEVKTPVGDTPDATTGIANLDELPKGTTVTWKEPIDTKTPGHKEGTVVVTYPDGTTEEVTVPVKVGTDAQINEPTAQEVKTPVGGTPEATTGIANLDELPKGTTVTWKEPVDTTTPGHREGTVVVTYPDGTTEEVTVPVKVGTDAQINEPTAQEVKTPVGDTPEATTGIANLDELPKGTTVTWKEPIDTTTPGHKEGTAVVTYPDGTTEEVTVPVKVGTDADIYTPNGQEVKTPVGGTPEATTGIANLDELPAGTTVAWKEPIDTKTPGHKEGTVVVTYPDGTTEEVTVPVKVGTDAQINEPTAQEVKTPVGGTPEATTGIANLDELPKGTTVTWKEPVDTTTPGHREGTVVVTYPDGTTEEVTVPVKVGTDAQINEPTAQEVKTPVGDTPEATTGIANLDELPKGTTVTWKEPIDTTTPGHKEGTAVVTYPDGTTEEVTVPVKVGTDADIYTPNGQEVKTPVGGTPEATTGIANLDELPAGTTVAWKEPIDTKTPGHKEGTVVVTYPDGTTEEVTVPVKVGTDAQINEPTAQEVKTPVGGTPEATTGIANLDELPKGTTVTWKEPVDTTTPGHREGTVVVTYPDGTTEEVTVPVKVGTDAQINEPIVVPITSEIGKLPTPEEFISNLNELPTGTVVTWNGEPNVSKAGNVKVSLLVTYPDGSSEVLEAELIIVGETKEMVQRPQTKPNVAATTDEQVKPMSTTNEPANAENKPDELPQTGDIDGQKVSALGMLSMLAGLFGIGVAKRKKRDEE
ncbi:hypothetical protein CPQ89_10560 [Ligilactobacillus murinus]|uniref:Gram-positive cocci surface proteins LPxTG domain-containing protein n=1 Tax=Ligilactobacillus murinus TaxID=1622 RepID=A0ABN5MHJ3_9LACO|nr:Rib/alpha-like domain-containing protein [Ligilactobacillus murinus]AWZ41425.1 hypothetical protein CPQ89_10560 [Ligilactobacillus murinus]